MIPLPKIHTYWPLNNIIAEMPKGMYDLSGNAAIGGVGPVGKEILEEIGHF